MASLLETRIREAIERGFRGKLLTGTLRRVNYSGQDAYGDPLEVGVDEHTFEGFVDVYDAAYRARAGIPETDVRVVIIAGSLAVDPIKDDKVQVRSEWFQLRSVKTDPARAAWECQAFKVEAP